MHEVVALDGPSIVYHAPSYVPSFCKSQKGLDELLGNGQDEIIEGAYHSQWVSAI